MQIALIADSFPPLRTSGAVQLRDLSREFVRQGHALGSMPFRVERDIKLDVWSTRLIGAWPRRTAMPADE